MVPTLTLDVHKSAKTPKPHELHLILKGIEE